MQEEDGQNSRKGRNKKSTKLNVDLSKTFDEVEGLDSEEEDQNLGDGIQPREEDRIRESFQEEPEDNELKLGKLDKQRRQKKEPTKASKKEAVEKSMDSEMPERKVHSTRR